ncbi:MAG: DUF1460 domain-containing protein [Muribaculaceae bacterium]|nr:DUF1460 domain-containing protein [Muribaculaceae bacterium]
MMKVIKIHIISLLLLAFIPSLSRAQVRYHCPQDSERAMELVKKASVSDNYGERIVAAAKALQGIPFAPAADNDSIGTLVIRLDSLNQREFIYNVLAAAKTAQLSAPTIHDFEQNLIDISRKKGTDQGFVSQFLYGADWIGDNVYRGNLLELTDYPTGGNYKTKTLDYVSRHPQQFPAMSDPEIVDKIKVIEFGYRSHRIPHKKKHNINDKEIKGLLQDGDIILMCPMDDDFDIYDIGIISRENGEPTLIHISKDKGEVVLDPYPISRLFKVEGQYFYGFRWLRPTL